MVKHFSILISFVYLMILLPTEQQVTSQTSREYYAYLQWSSIGELSLKGIHISPNRMNTETLSDIILDDNQGIYAARLSPDSNWIALSLASSPNGDSLYLYDIRDNNLLLVQDSIKWARLPPTFDRNKTGQHFAWSPDSRYFAFTTVSTDEFQILSFYDLKTQVIAELNSTNENLFGIAWSHNSEKLVSYSHICNSEQKTFRTFKIFNSSDGSSFKNFENLQFQGCSSPFPSFCEFEWSPTDDYISFQNTCGGGWIGGIQEVYVWDWMNNNLIQATYLSPTDIAPGDSAFSATHDIAWLDESYLLVGYEAIEGIMFQPRGPQIVQSLLIDVLNNTTQILSESRLADWAVGTSNNIAYVRYSYPNEGTDEVEQPSYTTIEVGKITQERVLNSPVTLVPGCNLIWNTDSTLLAYWAIDKNHVVGVCPKTPEQFHFYDSSSNNSYTIEIQGSIIPLGWMRQ